MNIPTGHEAQEYKDRLRWHLQRVDSWISNADAKGSILLALSGALITAVFSVAPEIISGFLTQGWVGVVISVMFLATGALATLFAAWAILPTIGVKSWPSTVVDVVTFKDLKRSKPGNKKGSLFHFADVAQLGEDFDDEYRAMSTSTELEHLEHQVKINSAIATKKFMKLGASVGFLMLALVLGIIAMSYQNAVNFGGNHDAKSATVSSAP